MLHVWALILVVVTTGQKTPNPVDINFPYLVKMSEELAAKYQEENCVKASMKSDQFIMLGSLAQRTTAGIVTARQASLPFLPPAHIQMHAGVPNPGILYFISGIVEQQYATYGSRKLNPWPMWQIVTGKVWRMDSGESYVMNYVKSEVTDVEHFGAQKPTLALKYAMDGVNSEYPDHKLISILAIQT